MTETAIVQRQSGGIVAREEFSRQQVELIRQTLMPGANDNELALYLEYAKRTGLDPFAKQLIPIRTWDRDNNRYRWEFMAGIDGLRLVAQRTGDYDGFEGPFFRGKGGEWTDFWDGDGPPAECKFIVYRKGATRGFPGRVKYAEFVRKNRKGEVYGPWLTQPEHMLRIRAESHALRAAFPRETSGLYLREDDEGELYQPPPQIVNPDAPATDPQKGQLHKLADQLGWDDDTYRDELERATGKRTSKELTKGAAHEAITAWTLLYETGEVATDGIVDGELVEDVEAAGIDATTRPSGAESAETPASTNPQETSEAVDPVSPGKSGGRRRAAAPTPGTAAPPDAHQFEGNPDDDEPCAACGKPFGAVAHHAKQGRLE